jgi:DNA-binding transcriptional LysR family regulator
MALRNMRIWRYIDEVARVGSVRQAASRLNVTPSALLRRIQDVEYDLNATVFERHASGVQLTAAGEVLIHWIRRQNADLRRVYSQIEELSGLQLGEIRIACSQAVARSFIIKEIVEFQKLHPKVRFHITVSDHHKALQSLIAYESDVVLIFRPSLAAEFQTILSVGQGLVAIMAADHPLAAQETLRLRDCSLYDVALPDRSFGGREIIEDRLASSSAKFNVVLETNSFDMLADYVMSNHAITFQIDIGALGWRSDPRFAVRPLHAADNPYGPLVLGQLKGRTLPLAAAKFAEQLCRRLEDLRTLPMREDGPEP